MTATLLFADCLEAMAEMESESVDAIVTDPPYGINFMGAAWDGKAIEEAASRPVPLGGVSRLTGSPDSPSRKLTARTGSGFANRAGEAGAYDFSLKGNAAFQQWCETWGREALRVLKPGGHALVFGGTRTYHRLTCGLEDAGFEIRDCLAWLFGSGFPKSHDIAKAIDKAEGHWRGRAGEVLSENGSMSAPNYERTDKGEPATPEALAWQGYGTALKPAHEPIVLARKPFAGTVATNVQKHGTGALNIDATRILFASTEDQAAAAAAARLTADQNANRNAYGRFENGPASLQPYLDGLDKGRWPANVLLDEEAAALVDEQSGQSSSSSMPLGHAFAGETYGVPKGRTATETVRGFDDFGGASRFFFTARKHRIEGCEHVLTAEEVSSLGETQTDSAQGDAATSDNPEATLLDDCLEPSTNETQKPSKTGLENDTPTTPPIASESSPESPLAKPILFDSHAKNAEAPKQTDTTTTTASPLTSAGDAEAAMCDSTSPNTDPGDRDLLPIDLGASRFKYCAKVSRAERTAGCEALPRHTRGEDVLQSDGGIRPPDPPITNFHPTVKPIDLMRYLIRYLIRLITPLGGVVLDPFLGSGSTGCAAALENRDFIGIEREPDYMKIAEARIAFWAEHGEDGLRICAERDAADRVRTARAEAGQLDLLSELA